MFKSTLTPYSLPTPANACDPTSFPLWELEDVLGLETETTLLPTKHPTAVMCSVFKVWIKDNGVAKRLDLDTFVAQFPSYAIQLVQTLHRVRTEPFAEKMDANLDLTIDDAYCDVTILFTPTGTAGWVENIDYTLDDFTCNATSNPFETQEDADQAGEDLDIGRLCTLFTPAAPSAHETFETFPKREKTFDTWKKVIGDIYPDLFTLTEWSLEVHHA